MIKVAPSLLAADFMCLESELKRVADGGADCLHFDVMDGAFVPNISMGLPVVEAVAKGPLPIDAHLMIEHPEAYIERFAAAGARIITVHAEATHHLHRAIQQIHACGALAGVALNPATPPDCLKYVLGDLDLVLIMTVNPGFGGQKLIPACLDKLDALRAMLPADRSDLLIEVDGGVNEQTAPALVAHGANLLVAGTATFRSDDPGRVIRALKALG